MASYRLPQRQMHKKLWNERNLELIGGIGIVKPGTNLGEPKLKTNKGWIWNWLNRENWRNRRWNGYS